jgi:ribonuclease D
MKKVRGMRSDLLKSVLITEILEELNELSENGFDKSLKRKDKEKEVSLPPSQQSLYEILKLLLKIKSNEYGVVSHLITSEKNLREFIKNPNQKNIILKDWRFEVFGKTAQEFRDGKLGLTYNPESHDIIIKEI